MPLPLGDFAQSLARFRRDTRGGVVERWALIMGSIAVACVGSANLADTAAKRGIFPEIVWHTGGERTRIAQQPESVGRAPGTIDYTVTASIASPAAVTRLDPCTGKSK